MYWLLFLLSAQPAPAAPARVSAQTLPLASAAHPQIKLLQAVLGDYKRYCHRYPTTEQGLAALAARPDRAPDCPDYPESTFVVDGRVPVDPWGRSYTYTSDGGSYTLSSLGQDGREGGEGLDADLIIGVDG